MYYFYVLEFARSKKLYKGLTHNLRQRLMQHKRGESDFTARNGTFELIFFGAYLDKRDAIEAERYFKSGHGREVLRTKLKNYFSASSADKGGVA